MTDEDRWPADVIRAGWGGLVGHDERVAMFRRAAGKGRLAQAYLLEGPGGVGKRLFARLAAKALFCRERGEAEFDACGACPSCVLMAAGTHPDLVEVGLIEGKRQLTVDQFVGSKDEPGGLGLELARSPSEADRKVAIIDSADRMGVEAANAFLKTLEEPPEGVVIFLIAESAGGLLPTILSRCQRVRFPGLSEGDLATLIERVGLASGEEAASIARLADGGLDAARKLADGSARQLRDDLVRDLAGVPCDKVAAATHVLAAVEELKDAQAKRERLGWVTRFGSEFFRDAVRAASGGGGGPAGTRWAERVAAAGRDPVETAGLCLERLDEFDRHVAANASIPLAVEALADDLARLTKV